MIAFKNKNKNYFINFIKNASLIKELINKSFYFFLNNKNAIKI